MGRKKEKTTDNQAETTLIVLKSDAQRLNDLNDLALKGLELCLEKGDFRAIKLVLEALNPNFISFYQRINEQKIQHEKEKQLPINHEPQYIQIGDSFYEI